MKQNKSGQPHDWQEGRRLRAWELYQQGWKQIAIADALGVTSGAVSQWVKRGQRGGREALRRRVSPGAPTKLSPAQQDYVLALLAYGAEAFGFPGDLWTTKRVAHLIERVFRISYHPAHVSRLLRQWGWSSQEPIQRAAQRNEAAIATWLQERWPSLKKEQKRKDERLSG